MPRDEISDALIGNAIWHSLRWIEAHNADEPYEIFTEPDEKPAYGYRVTVERIPAPEDRIPMGHNQSDCQCDNDARYNQGIDGW